MKIEVLASVMDKKDYEILKKMNINSDAIIINQCDKFKYDEFIFNGNNIRFISLKERGVGLSRNNALMRATGDIVVFADEDEIFINNYEKIILSEFRKYPKADMIIFSVPSLNSKRPTINIEKAKKIHKFNCMKYGAVNIAVRLDFIHKKNIYFTLLFGGGAKYLSGEDSKFIIDIINNCGVVYASPKIIAYVKQDDSTWFQGYNEKYFISKGAFYFSISKHFWTLYCFQFLFRHKNTYSKLGLKKALKNMKKGAGELKCKKNQ